jgi:hypothetical protein
MLAVRPNAKERLRRSRDGGHTPTPGRWQRLALCLLAAASLCAGLAAIGAPLWLSVCVGVLAGLRVATPGSRGARSAGTR